MLARSDEARRLDQRVGARTEAFQAGDGLVLQVLQDTAATKPVYYHRDAGTSVVTVSSLPVLVAEAHGLDIEPRVAGVYENPEYAKDPSRYLPGMITYYADLLPLTANHSLDLDTGRSRRFFPREPLEMQPYSSGLVDQVADVMTAQARILAATGRHMRLAATGGRDSRTSLACFNGQPNTSYFSFHFPTNGHLSEDVDVARQLAEVTGSKLEIYNLEEYRDKQFSKRFFTHSPKGIWPAAAQCYLEEFQPNDIHIRSTVSEIGRIFYGRRVSKEVSAKVLARTYTGTDFHKAPMVVDTMQDFMDLTDFRETSFFNYDLYDMFYWEHRNAKWQNILCAEAEMATDVFIPFNNRNLLKMFMSVPLDMRRRANIHLSVCNRLVPEFKKIPIV